MKNIALIALFGFLCGNFSVFAQAKTTEMQLVAADSIKGDEIDPLSPAKAAFYSGILPGLGQAYNRQYWKVPVVYLAIGTSTYFYVSNNRQYHRYRDEYKRRLAGTSDPTDPYWSRLKTERIVDAQKYYQRNRDLSLLITVGFYILNIVEANVSAHLMQFNVNDNLSLRPDFPQNDIDYKRNVGLTLNYSF